MLSTNVPATVGVAQTRFTYAVVPTLRPASNHSVVIGAVVRDQAVVVEQRLEAVSDHVDVGGWTGFEIGDPVRIARCVPRARGVEECPARRPAAAPEEGDVHSSEEVPTVVNT